VNYLTRLLKVVRIVCGAYYQTANTCMKTKNNDSQCHTHMFDVKELLPVEYRTTPLPSPQKLAQQFFTIQNVPLNNQ